jgi:hypothetical protein
VKQECIHCHTVGPVLHSRLLHLCSEPAPRARHCWTFLSFTCDAFYTTSYTCSVMASRTELLAWVNDLLQIGYTKIEQLGGGGAFCQIINTIYGA